MGTPALLMLLLLIAAWGYQLLALVSLWRFFKPAPAELTPSKLPGITIFKPLKGLEANTRECLESFLSQAYQPYQVIFGVRNPEDPVVALLRELQETREGPDIEIVFCPENLGLNPKISSLRQMEAQARFELLVIADADVKVAPDFLSRVTAALQEPGMGLVSCPYRFGPAPTIGAKLEALTIAADFIPSVATAHYVEGIRFALGAAMAINRRALQAIGGFAPLADFLADDYQLGWRVAEAGWGVKILPYVVETQNPDLSLKDYLVHQTRWARTYRVCRPKGFLAYGITHALVYSLALCLATGAAPWALGWALATLSLRWTLSGLSEWTCLRGQLARNDFWLLPVKDLLSFGLWALSFLGDRVTWGGKTYRVTPEGKLAAI
ncbi:MAG: bacteriohopanetetrol glucosamine biosynthesis glycosyltransferase HpnI [Deltaproteobacteria bacterium]|nr:bacteriohopanetetrol glucosamine biosynthesis glycosyltransferase HpnI [Deltaproteobacteria bacterium]